MSITHGPTYLGVDAYDVRLSKPAPAPRYSLDYTAHDGDDRNFRPQIEIHATIGYDLDGTAVHVRCVTVEAVTLYARPDYSQGVTIPFEYVNGDGEIVDLRPTYEPFVKAAAATDEAWQSRAYDAAIEAGRCGSDY